MSLKITTWNVLAPYYIKCADYRHVPCEELNIRVRRPKIVNTLKQLDSDIFLLQEVTCQEFKHLTKEFANDYRLAIVVHHKNQWRMKDRQLQRNGNAIMVKRSFGHIANLHKIKISLPGNYALLATVVKGDQLFYVCSLHLDDVSHQLRCYQVHQLLDFFKSLPNSSKLIVGGDMNEQTKDIVNLFKSHEFQVSHAKTPTYFDENTALAIDYIFAKNLKVSKTLISKTNAEHVIEKFGSDHVPVRTILVV